MVSSPLSFSSTNYAEAEKTGIKRGSHGNKQFIMMASTYAMRFLHVGEKRFDVFQGIGVRFQARNFKVWGRKPRLFCHPGGKMFLCRLNGGNEGSFISTPQKTQLSLYWPTKKWF